MCEVADEELNDIIPRSQKPISEGFQDIGYYTDEYGHKRFGIIPKNPFNTQVKATWDFYDGKNRTSDPRYR